MVNTPTEKPSILTTLLTGLLFFSIPHLAVASPDCQSYQGCEKKFCEIEKQIAISLEKGNERKAEGLREALKNSRRHCTDKGLEAELAEEIQEAKEEMAEYESDLKEATEHGEEDKVRKYQGKIEEEKNKIKSLERELSDLD
ncbi:DUF1090 domain-containing protein [Pseudomaricurvus sp.]|uniref:DUF1090 domain-containing protein n=1 Tax=Pseudomaricurvus sp. TaxID=2004510 RepID=UPI003F6A5E43